MEKKNYTIWCSKKNQVQKKSNLCQIETVVVDENDDFIPISADNN